MNPRFHEIHRAQIQKRLYRSVDQQRDALLACFSASIILVGFGIRLSMLSMSGGGVLGGFFSLPRWMLFCHLQSPSRDCGKAFRRDGLVAGCQSIPLDYGRNVSQSQSPKTSLDAFGFKWAHVHGSLIKLEYCRPRFLHPPLELQRSIGSLRRILHSSIKILLIKLRRPHVALVEYKMPEVEARKHNLFCGNRKLKHNRIMQPFRVLSIRFRMILPRPHPAPPGR